MKNKKVVFIISPQWFVKNGVKLITLIRIILNFKHTTGCFQ